MEFTFLWHMDVMIKQWSQKRLKVSSPHLAFPFTPFPNSASNPPFLHILPSVPRPRASATTNAAQKQLAHTLLLFFLYPPSMKNLQLRWLLQGQICYISNSASGFVNFPVILMDSFTEACFVLGLFLFSSMPLGLSSDQSNYRGLKSNGKIWVKS